MSSTRLYSKHNYEYGILYRTLYYISYYCILKWLKYEYNLSTDPQDRVQIFWLEYEIGLTTSLLMVHSTVEM